MRWWALLLALAAACDDDLPAMKGMDLATAAADLAALSDLGRRGDGACTRAQFIGFDGTSDVERRLDCACGCDIDAFSDTQVSAFWGQPASGGGSYSPGSDGLAVTVTRTDMTEFAALVSTNPSSLFYLDGDFDVTVDYELRGAVPPDAHAMLMAATPANSNTVERARLPDGSDVARSLFPGITPAARPDGNPRGTLELFRQGSTLEAIADGQLVSQFIGAGAATRFSLQLFVTLGACDADAGAGCSFTVAWSRLSMTGGALVDRR